MMPVPTDQHGSPPEGLDARKQPTRAGRSGGRVGGWLRNARLKDLLRSKSLGEILLVFSAGILVGSLLTVLWVASIEGRVTLALESLIVTCVGAGVGVGGALAAQSQARRRRAQSTYVAELRVLGEELNDLVRSVRRELEGVKEVSDWNSFSGQPRLPGTLTVPEPPRCAYEVSPATSAHFRMVYRMQRAITTASLVSGFASQTKAGAESQLYMAVHGANHLLSAVIIEKERTLGIISDESALERFIKASGIFDSEARRMQQAILREIDKKVARQKEIEKMLMTDQREDD